MSLDSSEINDNNSIAYFQSVIVDTDDINREKNNIADANGIISEHVDYKILKVNSYYRLVKDGEWLDIDPNNYNFFYNNDFFLVTNLEIS